MSGLDEAELTLQGIFRPAGRRYRDEIFHTQGMSVRFAHYTSASAALSIIGKKRMWMRNTLCMSDYLEVAHGYSTLHSFFSKYRSLFVQALDQCHAGAASEALEQFDQLLPLIRENTYITSISEHQASEDTHGRLSMWRAFGAEATRVALVLNIPYESDGAEALSLDFSPVTYASSPDVETDLIRVIANINDNCEFLRSQPRERIITHVFHMLLEGVTGCKHKGFREEREWRAIYCPDPFEPVIKMPTSTQVVAGIPQIVQEIPLDAKFDPVLEDLELSKIFDRLIIGPTQYPLPIFQAFKAALQNAGILSENDYHDRIVISDIPIRT